MNLTYGFTLERKDETRKDALQDGRGAGNAGPGRRVIFLSASLNLISVVVDPI